MTERNDISGLLAFISREGDWRERLQDVVAEHLMPALEEFEIDQDGLADLLGEQWSGVLWGCGFEDFLGQRYEDGNIVDLYLKRRGWKETALNRAYFTALRDAPVSLYEVSDVKPGTSMVLRDLLSDAVTVTVKEKSATRTLKQWDRIPELQVRIIPEARPLIHALGNFDPRAIPEPLEAVLFAPDGPAADLPGEGGDRPADATRVFAVLDAAKLPYLLTAFIESSGMCQQSLFQGAAQRELGEYAPYLIELDRTNAFTRKLFTSVEQRGFWQAELGILIRARADFTAMRRHLRRFVRVRDDAGSWFYWRFWEGRRLAAALGALDGRDRVDFMMKGAIETIVVLTSDPAALQIGLAAPEPSPLNGARR